jgi:phosphodiesterase/alkaline phosphatase D-like protein
MSIKYGPDRGHLNQTAEAVLSNDERNYHARVEGLTPETRYYFQIMQKDEPVGGVGTFVTVASGAAPIKSKAIVPQ